MEYRGVDLQTGEEIFHQRFARGTNNVGEFLAIVHGLAYETPSGTAVLRHHLPLERGRLLKAIYTDSKTAMSWVRQGKCKSLLRKKEPDLEVWKAVDRAEEWLKVYGIPYQLLKWKTEDWGEIPADFGRK
ncbi:hypothetical protein FACS1894176_07990 [Bacteroidia bacterium]|nr:hypothetical protein FACS1894176_07990 [Bacteroidia bacterium]